MSLNAPEFVPKASGEKYLFVPKKGSVAKLYECLNTPLPIAPGWGVKYSSGLPSPQPVNFHLHGPVPPATVYCIVNTVTTVFPSIVTSSLQLV